MKDDMLIVFGDKYTSVQKPKHKVVLILNRHKVQSEISANYSNSSVRLNNHYININRTKW